MSSYYDILDIQKDATPNDIKKAYRKLAIQHHPDKGGDTEEFKKIAEAYEILSNPDKKQQYDNFGSVNMNANFNPMNIFQEFEQMFQGDMFGPNRIGSPPFGGFPFPNQTNQSNQTNPLTNLFMNMGSMDMDMDMNNGCFTQTIIIKDGKKTTTKTSNGKTTVIEETIRPTNRLS